MRWLRPEFQNPSGAAAAQQQALPGASGATSAATPTSASLPKWPAKLPDQLRAVRDALAAGERSWSSDEVARSFKGAKRAAVESALEALAALGQLVAFEANGEKRWKAPARSAA